VNPFLGHSKEPAPMGVADYGVTGPGAGGSAYEYATSSLEAAATVRSMSLSAVSGGGTSRVAAFELNAVLVLQKGGENYSYWIQNGLHVDTSTDKYTIGGAYVWNFSSSNPHLSGSELSGNASSSLASDTYYFIPGCGVFAGQCTTLTLPVTLTARIAIATCGAYPCVNYEYDLGAGWVTYDTVSFLHMAGATETGFVIDGFSYTPNGGYYDAEWDWVAAGGGVSGDDLGSNLQMGLDFWNGHNYQAVPTAWNFGGDTGETSYNVTEALAEGAPDGAPLAQVESGPGTLGVLYNESAAGFLNVTPVVPSAMTVKLDGSPVALLGGSANFTLVPGTYTVALENYSNASLAVTVRADQTTALNFSGAGLTSFEEVGLPHGTSWGLTVDGSARSGPASVLAVNLPNGTYAITYSKVPGFYRNSSDPTSVEVPDNTTILVDWSSFTFQVPVNETGLPTGSPWWVEVGTTVVRGTSASLDVAAPNGSTEFTVGAAYEFLANPSQGTINVTAGTFPPVDIQFSYRPTYIAGSVSPADADVTVDGIALSVSSGSFNDSVIPGTHALIASAPGYLTRSLQVVATPGNVTVEQITLTQNTTVTVAPTSSGGSSGVGTWAYVAIGAAVVVAAGAVALVLFRRRRPGENPPSQVR
jgi:hypothetical protein